MMYITTMRVNSRTEGIGVNIFLHLRPGAPDQQNPWKVVDDPGPVVDAVSWREVKSGGNGVEAYLDLLLDENDYSPELLASVLEKVAAAIEAGQPSTAKMEFPLGHGRLVRVLFAVNLGLADLTSKRRVFGQLRGTFERWLSRHAATLEATVHQRRAVG